MRITNLSVGRPIFTIMVVLIVLILGVVSLTRLPIDLMPELTYPTLTVATNYENAAPEEMEELVTRPIEEAVAAVPGVEELTSISAEGQSQVRVTFTWGTNLDEASNDIRDRLDRIINRLPDDADRPQLRKFDAAQFPILLLGASSRLDPIELRQLIDNQLKQRIERIPGVAALDVWGGLEREIQVNLDPDKIRALDLPLDVVVQGIRDANINVPAGTIERGRFDVTLRTPGEFTSLDELRGTTILEREGQPIYLGQVANVLDTHQRQTRFIRINGEPGVRLAVRKQSGTNTVQVANEVLRELNRVNNDFPQVNLVPVINTATYIERAITNVGRTILIGGTLALFVLLFFLRNIRSTLVIGTAIPISIIATFTLLYFNGFTLNLMTLGGLALGVGMMVDSSIVVLENIYRLREEGLDAKQAAVQGTEQVTPAIVASTITTLVIFLPLVFVEGIAGVMFLQFAYVVAFALICSLLVALTLVPMLAARLLKAPPRPRPRNLDSAALEMSMPQPAVAMQSGIGNRLFAVSGAMFDRIEASYKELLTNVLRWRLVTLLVVGLVFAGAIWLVPYVGTEFMPETDEGEVRVNVEAETGTRVELVDQIMHRVEAIVAAEVADEVENMVVNVGASGWRPSARSRGDIQMSLVPDRERTRSSEQVAADLRPLLSDIPGVEIRTRASQGIASRLMSRGGGDGDSLAIEVRGFELSTLAALADEVQRALEGVPGITDVRLSREAGSPQQLFRIDRTRAADLGLSVNRIARTLETAVAGTRAADYREAGYEYPIRVRLDNVEQMDIDEILNLTVMNRRDEQVALRNVVELAGGEGPTQIERKDQQRLVQVNANIADRDLGSVVRDIRESLRDIPVPRNYEVIIAGDYEDQQEAFSELGLSLILALMLVYMVMACLYESLRDPVVVMFAVPLALIGVVIMLLLTNTTFNVQSFIGIIMLGGIVVNNAILIVDQATRLRRDEHQPTREAVSEAGRRRLRPILMTTCTTALGLTPLALGLGEGADAQAPMARAVVGGLLSASLITLVVIPVLYSYFHRDPAPHQATPA
ncbi:efflux RND transporter permease subunit [Phycisphaerales bacterium AB-hyl4]|uniref:Efflux RND transporter permease subunit n=1 Tax=Natronomicrosphaera hydrolytica TaxID=3242702 RepID=A0ABV4UBB3_9BACT